MGYTILDNQDQPLKNARAIARSLWNKNYHAAEVSGNEMRSYNHVSRLLFSDVGYADFHNRIFETFAQGKDPNPEVYLNEFFKGLHDEFNAKGITYDSLKHCLTDESRQSIEAEIAKLPSATASKRSTLTL